MRNLLASVALALVAASTAHAQTSAFIPTGATANVAVTATAQNLTLPLATAGTLSAAQRATLSAQIVLTNIGTQTVFFRVDGTTATASNAMPIIANSQFVISVPFNSTASVIAATTGSTLYATVGYGQ